VLFNIPDGHTKTAPITTVPVAIAQSDAKVIKIKLIYFDINNDL